jgi:hypothetical protein
MTSAESALPNAVVRIPLDQDGWNGLPKSRQALMQLEPGDPGVCTSAIRQKIMRGICPAASLAG